MTLPDKADFLASYGGRKTDYYPVEDPTTDVADVELNNLRADAAALTRVTQIAWVQFQGTAVNGAVACSHDAVWGTSLPPTVTKTATTGKYTIQWPSTITDGLGVVRYTAQLDHGLGYGSTTSTSHPLHVAVEVAGNFATVLVWDMFAGPTASDAVGLLITVEVYG